MPTTATTSEAGMAAFAREGCCSLLLLLPGAVERIGAGARSKPMLIPGFLGSVLSITTARELLYQRGGCSNVSIVLWCHHYASAPSTQRAWALCHCSSTCSTDTMVCSPNFNLVTKSLPAPEARPIPTWTPGKDFL